MFGIKNEAWNMRSKKYLSSLLISSLAITIASFSNQKPALASMEFCNRTNSVLWTAYGRGSSIDRVATSGWWRLSPGECRIVNPLSSVHVFRDDSSGRELAMPHFYYAEAEDGRSWEGGFRFCVSDSEFNFDDYLFGRSSESRVCPEGYYLRDFQVMTNVTRANHTLNFR